MACRNPTTWTPCGLTPDMTCSIALSLPAASIAWKTTSSAYVSLAQSSSCASESSSTPRASTAFASAFSSSCDSASKSGPPVQPGSRSARAARSTRLDEQLLEYPLSSRPSLLRRDGSRRRTRAARRAGRRACRARRTARKTSGPSRQMPHCELVSATVSKIRCSGMSVGDEERQHQRGADQLHEPPVRDRVAAEDACPSARGPRARRRCASARASSGPSSSRRRGRSGPRPRRRRRARARP